MAKTEDQAARLRKIVAEMRATQSRAAPARPSLTEALDPTRALAITSGKGGVGKTNMTVNLALALAQRKQRVLILDADLGLANVDVAMGLLPKYNLAHVIQGSKRLDEIIVRGPLGIAVIASGSGISELANLGDEARVRLLDSLATLKSRYDFLLIDTSAGLGRNVLGFVLAADEILIVTTPEPTALLDAYSMIKVVYQQNPEANVRVIVNMVRDEAEAREVADKLTVVAHRFIGVTVASLGHVVRDGRVGEAVKEQTPLLQLYPHSSAAKCIHGLALELTNGNMAARTDLKGFFSRVVDVLRGR